MLPQEVKELGVDQALIFYENLRPVRAKKMPLTSTPTLDRLRTIMLH
jgi:type IV secretory pathway TraG/TraD family ATPase VirD4